jgi:hypothetical protein
MKSAFLLLVATLSYSQPGFCWGALGHSVVGAIAEDRLSPEGKAFVAGVIGIEPLALAATFADSVRDDHERFAHDENERDRNKKNADDFNFSDYHFADVPTGYTYDSRPNKDLKDSFGAIRGAIEILQSGSAQPAEKMIALRYLIHVVGDIHQPLHIGNNHDIGANVCLIYTKNGREPKNMHSFWDTELVNNLGLSLVRTTNPEEKLPPYYSEFITALKNQRSDEYNGAKPSDTSLNAIKGWINESADIRENKANRSVGVYPEKPGQMGQYPGTEYMHRPYCMWFADIAKNVLGDTSAKSKKEIPLAGIPHLDDEYLNVNTKIVEQQLIKAGIRLAGLIDNLAKAARRPSLPQAEQEAILKTIQGIFHNSAQ